MLACKAAAGDILNISVKSLFLTDIMTLFLICVIISKEIQLKNTNKLMLG